MKIYYFILFAAYTDRIRLAQHYCVSSHPKPYPSPNTVSPLFFVVTLMHLHVPGRSTMSVWQKIYLMKCRLSFTTLRARRNVSLQGSNDFNVIVVIDIK